MSNAPAFVQAVSAARELSSPITHAAPAVVTQRAPSVDFVIGNDNQVHTRMLDASGEPMGPYNVPKDGEVKDLSATRYGPNLAAGVAVFVVGIDDQAYGQTIDPNNVQSGYFNTAYGSVSSVAAGTDSAGNLLLFAVSTAADNNQLYELKFDSKVKPASGSYTKAASGNFKSIVMTHDAGGNALLYALGQDSQVYGLQTDSTGNPVGGLFKVESGPVKQLAVGHDASNNPELFVIGTDDYVYGHQLVGSTGRGFGHYFSIGGPVSSISVTSDAANIPELFVISAPAPAGDGLVYGLKFNAGGFPVGSFFQVPGGTGAASINAGVGPDNAPILYAVATSDNQVYAAPFSTSGDPTAPFALTAALPVKKLVLA